VGQVGLFKVKKNVNKKFSQNNANDGDNRNHRNNGNSAKDNRNKIIYVWLSSHKAIFIVTGEPKESKYSYGVPIIPLHGYYKSKKKSYTAFELRDYYVVLNLPKDADIKGLKGKRVVIMGYDKDELYIDENNDEGEEGGEKE
jgi:hypothetical protein